MLKLIIITILFLNNSISQASEFHLEDMAPESRIEMMKSTLDGTNYQDQILCLKPNRDWEALGPELNFSSIDGQCQGLTPKQIRHDIKEAYKGDEWREKAAKLYQDLKENKEYHRYFNCKFIKRNIIRDQKDCTPSARDVWDQSFAHIKECKKISGKMGYVGAVYLPYKYSICPNSDGKHDLVIRVYIKKEVKKHKSEDPKLKQYFGNNMSIPLETKLERASEIWNEQNPLKNRIKFKFKLVQTPEDADYKIDLTHAESRGPYCKQWSTTWNSNNIAHEIGHMLGLDDEYNQIVGSALPLYHFTYNESYCNPESIMCDEGQPKSYHYYMIFRRLLCQ